MTPEKDGDSMGGRGGASGFPAGGPTGPTGPQSAADAKDLTELKNHMAQYGVNVVRHELAGQNFDNVRKAAAGMESILTEFPQAAQIISQMSLRGADLGKGTYAQASFYGSITLGNHYFGKTEDGLAKNYDHDVSTHWHPEGTNKDGIAVHETGHLLEAALVRKYISGSDYWARLDRADAWNKHRFSSKIVSEACKAAKKTPGGSGKKNAELISDVSRYASKNRAETLAECVADYRANGAGAKPLSVAVWGILKRELG